MTLSGALSDDLAAMETGMFQILPRLDLSGRALLFVDSHRNTRRGYSSESMVSVAEKLIASPCGMIRLDFSQFNCPLSRSYVSCGTCLS